MLAERRSGEPTSSLEPASEKESWELDDVADRDELRSRYGMLLQELRVILPGVQILSAFLLTAAFSQRFGELDVWGRRAYGVALTASIISVTCLLAPTMLHASVTARPAPGGCRGASGSCWPASCSSASR